MKKTCSYCHIEKDLNEFHKSNARSHTLGHHNECKDCRRRHYIRNREIYRIRAKLAMRRWRERHGKA